MKNIINHLSLFFAISVLLSIQINAQEIIPCKKITFKCAQIYGGNYFINNDAIYHEIFQVRSPHPACLDYSFPIIDFSQYSLLGIVTSTGGCSAPKINYWVIKNSDNNYIYELNIEQQGYCKVNFGVEVWCLIPKIADSCVVDFKINHSVNMTKRDSLLFFYNK